MRPGRGGARERMDHGARACSAPRAWCGSRSRWRGALAAAAHRGIYRSDADIRTLKPAEPGDTMVVYATAVACIISAFAPAAVAAASGAPAADHASGNWTAQGNWSAAAAMPTARQGPSAALLPGGTVLVAGGRTSAADSAATRSTSRFTTSGSWRSAGQVRPSARMDTSHV